MITTGRRGFFKFGLDELIALFGELRGRRSFKLTDLAGLSDNQIGRLVPAILDASNVRTDHDQFTVTDSSGHSDVLFKIDSIEEDIWARLDGRSSLQEIADSVALEWNQPSAVAFATTRKVFLQLASKQICVPLNPIKS